MRVVSDAYGQKEESATRKPVELYHFWSGDLHWRFTSGDVAIDFVTDEVSNTYAPASINRGVVSFDTNLEISSMQVDIATLNEPTIQFLAQNPVEMVWLEVIRLFRDQTPYEGGVVFLGQISSVVFKGVGAQVTCTGFEHFLDMAIPSDRYQPQCNATVFDTRCGAAIGGYSVTTVVLVSADGFTVVSSDFALQEDGFYTLGHLAFGDTKRMVAVHVGDTLTLRYRLPGLVTGSEVTVAAGCDGYVETCRDKFDNVLNFRGHPFIPWDNPVTWA